MSEPLTAPALAQATSPEKPIINPVVGHLQAQHPTPPSSTIAEAPRSPNPLNPAAQYSAQDSAPVTPLEPNGTHVPQSTAPPPPPPSEPAPKPPTPPAPLPDAFPTPANTSFDAPMDVDVKEEASSGVKRHGEELASEDAKRVKEQSHPVASRSVTPAAPSTPAPIVPAAVPGAPAIDPATLPWNNYVAPAPRDPGPTTPLTLTQHRYLTKTVQNMLKNNNSANFRYPVDTELFNIPHYHQVIPYPMDLGTVQTKLHASDPRGAPKDKSKMSNWDTSKGTYSSVAEVSKDIRQIWENTRKFNGRDHVVSLAASKLEEGYERALKGLPSEIVPAVASPAGPSSASSNRRASISQSPVIRRADDSNRPKREIHPPPSKDLGYEPGASRKPKRRNDPQIQWAMRTINGLEKTQKYFDIVSPFLYPIDQVIQAIPEYRTIIKQPIDLLMIKAKLEDGVYDDISEIDRDIRLLCNNATKFNPPNDAVHNAANALLQLWNEKSRSMPPKQPEPRAVSEDAIGDDLDDSDDEDKDVARLREAKAERSALDREITELEQRIARKPQKQRKPKAPKAAPRPRKYSTSKPSPSSNANGVAKKPRKIKETMYREEDDDDSEDEIQTITIAQKQELAEKIQVAETEILGQAVQIIQSTTNISGDREIELDIDSLPAATIIKLYNLVCRGRKRGKKNKTAPRKSGFGGAPGRKHLNEQEEADRIRKMEAQLQSFEGRSSAAAAAYDEDSSSEEESSDEE